MKKLLSIIFLLTVFFEAQASQKTDTNIVTEDWKTLNQTNYTIQYPANWELNQSGQMGTSFVIFSPRTSEQDKFTENINLIIQDLTGKNIDLNSYTKISENQIKTMITNANILESKRIRKGMTEYQKIIYTGNQGTFSLRFEQYYWVIANKAYVLTLTCEQEKYVNYKADAQRMMDSFSIKK